MTEKRAVMAFGRMNPPTTGHEKLMHAVHNEAKRQGASAHIIASHSHDSEKNPIHPDKKLGYLKKVAPKGVHVSLSSKEHPSLLHHASRLHAAGHEHLTVVAAGDREKQFHTLLHKYNGKKGPHGHYNFKSITIHSAGKRDPDAEGTEGISGTKMRAHAKAGDHKSFQAGLPKALHKHTKEIMQHVTEERVENKLFEEFLIESGAKYNDEHAHAHVWNHMTSKGIAHDKKAMHSELEKAKHDTSHPLHTSNLKTGWVGKSKEKDHDHARGELNTAHHTVHNMMQHDDFKHSAKAGHKATVSGAESGKTTPRWKRFGAHKSGATSKADIHIGPHRISLKKSGGSQLASGGPEETNALHHKGATEMLKTHKGSAREKASIRKEIMHHSKQVGHALNKMKTAKTQDEKVEHRKTAQSHLDKIHNKYPHLNAHIRKEATTGEGKFGSGSKATATHLIKTGEHGSVHNVTHIDYSGKKPRAALPKGKGRSGNVKLDERTLTAAEKRKREEVAQAIKRDNPNMPMDKKMAIATSVAKRTAEEVEVDEALTYKQRVARKMIMRRHRPKLIMRKKMLARKKAPEENIAQRARKAAIRAIRKRVAGKKGQQYHKLTPQEKIMVDQRVAKKQAIVDRIAKRMLPVMRKAELVRLKNRQTKVNEVFEEYINLMEVPAPVSGDLARKENPTLASKTKENYTKKSSKSSMKNNKAVPTVEETVFKFVDSIMCNDYVLSEKEVKKLTEKAVEFNVPYSILKEVYDQGIQEVDDKHTPQQSAWIKLNAFLARPDLVEKVLEWGTPEATAFWKKATPGEGGDGFRPEKQIDEISSDTASEYVKSASDARGHKGLPTKKVDNRYAGVKLAHDKLAKAGKLGTTAKKVSKAKVGVSEDEQFENYQSMGSGATTNPGPTQKKLILGKKIKEARIERNPGKNDSYLGKTPGTEPWKKTTEKRDDVKEDYGAMQDAKAHAERDGKNYSGDVSVQHRYDAFHMKKRGYTHFETGRYGTRRYTKGSTGYGSTKIGPEHHSGVSEQVQENAPADQNTDAQAAAEKRTPKSKKLNGIKLHLNAPMTQVKEGVIGGTLGGAVGGAAGALAGHPLGGAQAGYAVGSFVGDHAGKIAAAGAAAYVANKIHKKVQERRRQKALDQIIKNHQDAHKASNVQEARMPSSVIKSKQRNAEMSHQDFAAKHKDKSDDELRSMAWRHGYGKGSNYYVNKRNKGLEVKEYNEKYFQSLRQSEADRQSDSKDHHATVEYQKGSEKKSVKIPLKKVDTSRGLTRTHEYTTKEVKSHDIHKKHESDGWKMGKISYPSRPKHYRTPGSNKTSVRYE